MSRSVLRIFALAFVMFTVLAISNDSVAEVERVSDADASPDRPNVLVILTDDQDVSSLDYMPNLQRELVGEGVSFENAFATTATCCPSRASFFTGQYAHNHEIFQNFYPRGGAKKFREQRTDRDTIATVLDDAGYTTGFMGKYLNQYETPYIPPGWDRWWGYMGNYNGERDDLPKSQYRINDNGDPKVYRHRNIHETDYFARVSERFVRNQRGPWFLTIAPNSPHEPSYVAERHKDEFTDARLPVPESFNERDVSDKPRFVREMNPITGRERLEILGDYRKRLRSLQPADEMVAQLLDALRETGQLENTYIIYTSDNGYHFGEHRIRAGKGGPYEESSSVPLIIRGPDIESGSSDALAANIDWGPTIADWTGTEMSAPDGRSLSPVLAGEGQERRRLLLELIREDYRGYSAVRGEDFVYVEYENGEREYYDLAEDPNQLENAYGSLRRELKDRFARDLDALESCAAGGCRRAENGTS